MSVVEKGCTFRKIEFLRATGVLLTHAAACERLTGGCCPEWLSVHTAGVQEVCRFDRLDNVFVCSLWKRFTFEWQHIFCVPVREALLWFSVMWSKHKTVHFGSFPPSFACWSFPSCQPFPSVVPNLLLLEDSLLLRIQISSPRAILNFCRPVCLKRQSLFFQRLATFPIRVAAAFACSPLHQCAAAHSERKKNRTHVFKRPNLCVGEDWAHVCVRPRGTGKTTVWAESGHNFPKKASLSVVSPGNDIFVRDTGNYRLSLDRRHTAKTRLKMFSWKMVHLRRLREQGVGDCWQGHCGRAHHIEKVEEKGEGKGVTDPHSLFAERWLQRTRMAGCTQSLDSQDIYDALIFANEETLNSHVPGSMGGHESTRNVREVQLEAVVKFFVAYCTYIRNKSERSYALV